MTSNNLFNHLERNCFRCYPGIIAGTNENSRVITTLLITIGARYSPQPHYIKPIYNISFLF